MGFPKVVVFSCHWCSYTAADTAGLKRMAMDPHFVVIRTMCSARVDPEWVLKALSKGADGVLVLAGHPGRCHIEKVRALGPNPVDPHTRVSPKRLEMPWLDIKPPKRWDEGLEL
jgi:hypothetical protein